MEGKFLSNLHHNLFESKPLQFNKFVCKDCTQKKKEFEYDGSKRIPKEILNLGYVEISGDRKLGQMLANNFIKLEDSENNLMCKIEISKERLQSNKDRSGKILEYTLNVYLDLEVIPILSTNSILKKSK